MKPASPVIKEFKEFEVNLTEVGGQCEDLPVLFCGANSVALSRWELTWSERLVALVRGRIFVEVKTFGKNFQPIRLTTAEPRIHSNEII